LCDIEIGKAIVVVVAPDTAQTVAGTGHTSFFGHVGKGAIAVIVVKRVASGDAAVVEITAIYEIDVLPAITVEVGDAEAGAENLTNDGNALVSGIVDEHDTGLRGFVGELNVRRRGLPS